MLQFESGDDGLQHILQIEHRQFLHQILALEFANLLFLGCLIAHVQLHHAILQLLVVRTGFLLLLANLLLV